MGIRCLAVLALVALAPAAAVADTHPLECLGGIAFSKGEVVSPDDGADDVVQRVRLNCTWLAGVQHDVGVVGAGSEPGVVGVFPAAVVTVGSAKSPETFLGAIAYLRKMDLVHPLVRVLPLGFTTTSDETLRQAALVGVSFDFKTGCPKGAGFWRDACKVVRPGARLDFDGLYLWKQPRNFYGRFAVNIGFRLEMGDHH